MLGASHRYNTSHKLVNGASTPVKARDPSEIGMEFPAKQAARDKIQKSPNSLKVVMKALTATGKKGSLVEDQDFYEEVEQLLMKEFNIT